MPRYQVSSTSPVNSESSLEPPVFLTPVDVDPRSWFSNERTCIEWLHSAGILGAFAAGLVTTNEQPARIAGIGLMIPAVFVVIHAARMQAKRSKQLDARAIDSHFDRVGPTLLTFLLSLSLLANLTLSIDRTFFSGRAYEPNSPGAGRISPLQYFYTTAGVLALGIATAVTLPAHLGGAEGASLTSSTLGQPFLELEPRAVNHGPVRPKLLYANERTFIHWSHVCSLVSSTAAAITSSPAALGAVDPITAMLAGACLTSLALCLLGYAHHVYFWRARSIISRGDKRVDDPLGPPMLAATLLVAILGGLIVLLLPSHNLA